MWRAFLGLDPLRPSSPLPWVTGAWVAGLLCAPGAGSSLVAIATGVVAFSGAAVTFVWGSLAQPTQRAVSSAWRWLGCALALLAGVSLGPPPKDAALPPSGIARIDALVLATELDRDDRASAVLRVLRGYRLEDRAAVLPGTLLRASPAPLVAGTHVRLLARLVPTRPFRNPSPHPAMPSRFRLSGRAVFAGPEAVTVLHAPWHARLLDQARSRVRLRLKQTLPPRAAGIARALVLGEGQAVEETEQASVRDAGLLHVFAVSGLHVAILAGIAVSGLQRALLLWTTLAARFEVRRIACALGIPIALGYAQFAGGAPSAWRAAVTAAITWCLIAAGRRPDPLAATAAAAIVLGVIDPREVTRPAFLLSITATAAILSHGSGPRSGDPASFLCSTAALSARATLATAPIVLYCFGSVPIVGLVANVVLLPFGSTLLVQLSALHALSATLTPFGHATGPVFAAVSQAFLAACELFARIAPSFVWPIPDLGQMTTLCAGTMLVLSASGWRQRLVAAAVMLALLLALELRLRHVERPTGVLRVTFLDVGQGDAALVDLPDGRLMLIDAGGNPGGGPDPGARVLLPLLHARRRTRIDLAVLSHPHPDHYGGLRAVGRALPIDELWDNGQASVEADLSPTSAETAALLSELALRGTRIRGPAELCGRTFRAAAAELRVLAPCPRHDPGHHENDNSIVLRIDVGARSFLFAGDAEAHAEGRLVEARSLLRATVLKVGHHGSRTSSTLPFLRAVSPALAVISAGAGNRFGHPHAEARARLRAVVPSVVDLAGTGGTIVTTDGKSLQLRTWSGERIALP